MKKLEYAEKRHDYKCDLLNATNALKHLIDQSEENILQIDQRMFQSI